MTYQTGLFAGKVALVTGATTGIGAGIAAEIARHGARVVAVGLGADRFEAPGGLDIQAIELDVNDDDAVKDVIADPDRLDLVVNCAGVIRRVEEDRIDVFEKVLAINLTGTMRVCTHAREKLKASGGSIVNTASMLSFFGGGLVPAYSASRGGVAPLTKSLAITYAADGIRINAVAPGWIAIPLPQAPQDNPARAGPILDRTPLKRWGTPADVAAATMFLLSPAAAFMTGVVMPVDGGYPVA